MPEALPTRVLIVDDEEPLLQLIQRFVSHAGYEVDVCSSGADAWRVFSNEPARYSLVVLDLTLPDMPGEELARRMLEAGGAKLLISSGYPIDIEGFPAAERSRIGFLHKPFVPRMLLEAVEGLMGKRA